MCFLSDTGTTRNSGDSFSVSALKLKRTNYIQTQHTRRLNSNSQWRAVCWCHKKLIRGCGLALYDWSLILHEHHHKLMTYSPVVSVIVVIPIVIGVSLAIFIQSAIWVIICQWYALEIVNVHYTWCMWIWSDLIIEPHEIDWKKLMEVVIYYLWKNSIFVARRYEISSRR